MQCKTHEVAVTKRYNEGVFLLPFSKSILGETNWHSCEMTG